MYGLYPAGLIGTPAFLGFLGFLNIQNTSSVSVPATPLYDPLSLALVNGATQFTLPINSVNKQIYLQCLQQPAAGQNSPVNLTQVPPPSIVIEMRAVGSRIVIALTNIPILQVPGAGIIAYVFTAADMQLLSIGTYRLAALVTWADQVEEFGKVTVLVTDIDT